MTKTPSFAALRQFLVDLGFTHGVVPGSHVYFEHPRSAALLVFRVLRDDEEVGATYLTMTRSVLDDFGIMDRKDFDNALRERSLAV